MITMETIRNMTSNPNFGGFGYLGSDERDESTDEMLIEAAQELGLREEEVFLWANSRYGRKFMDPGKPKSSREFSENIKECLPLLKEEEENEKAESPGLSELIQFPYLKNVAKENKLERAVEVYLKKTGKDEKGVEALIREYNRKDPEYFKEEMKKHGFTTIKQLAKHILR